MSDMDDARTARSFEEMLADPNEQFDGRSELLASIAEYAAAPAATAGIQPPKAVAPPVTPLDTALEHVREARQFLGERNRYRKALEAIAECRAGMPYPVLARQALEGGPAPADAAALLLAAIRARIAAYRSGEVSPVGAFGDIVRLLDGSADEGAETLAGMDLMAASGDLEDPSVLRDLLLVAGEDVPLRRIAKWSAEDRAKVAEWAAREHLHASDNPVGRRPRPPLLDGGGDD